MNSIPPFNAKRLDIRWLPSPNFTPEEIEVEFAILHHTAVSLGKCLDIFLDPCTEVSAHYVIGQAGEIFQMVSAGEKTPVMAWHAGESCFQLGERKLEAFNRYSLGIELVNLNGNIYDYTKEQYAALGMLSQYLIALYPRLRNPERFLGHEHIAGFRGKLDPGICFDWQYFFIKNFPYSPAPQYSPALKKSMIQAFLASSARCHEKPADLSLDPDFQTFRQQKNKLIDLKNQKNKLK